ncbi:MAG: AraC family transcriptional regulator [Ekhidna sp.]
MFDALDDILKRIRLRSVFYFHSNFSSPWGMSVPDGPHAQFHLITKGSCVLKVDNKDLKLFGGDVVMFTSGKRHLLSDGMNNQSVIGSEVVQKIKASANPFVGDEVAVRLICGHFEFDSSMSDAFNRSLPDVLLLRSEEIKRNELLRSILELIVIESSSYLPGGDVLVSRLGEALFIHLIRTYSELHKDQVGFLAAIQDERISAALKLLHESPEKEWKLGDLARKAGMSRTSLANRFREIVGETPMNYLTNWRVSLAKQMLKESNLQVKEIAFKIGYQSEAAFIRVFRSRLNTTPLKYRVSS